MPYEQLAHDDLLALLNKAGWDTTDDVGVTSHGTTVTFFKITSPGEQRQETGQDMDDAIRRFLTKLDAEGDGK
jgi:hypothetical protein